MPKPMTCNTKAAGCFGKQDFRYISDEDVYRRPAGNRLTYRFARDEAGPAIFDRSVQPLFFERSLHHGQETPD